jgi:hypothetical protein
MNWVQSADTLILFHEDVQPIEITRTSHTAWTAASVTFSNIPTFDFGSGAEAVISATRGWPKSGAFKFNRLWLGGLKSRPQTMLASKVGSFFDLNKGTGLDDEGIDITLDTDRVNAIVNLFPGRSLQIFTTGGEFAIRGALGDPITPTKIPEQVVKATLHGSSVVRPVSVDGATIFVERGGDVVRQFTFNDLEQSFNAVNISILSEHLIKTPSRMAVRQSTDDFAADYVYLVSDDGNMAVLNILRDEDLLAWSEFTTTGDIEDVSVVDRTAYIITKRTIDGSTVRYIERLNSSHYMDASTTDTVGAITNHYFDTGIDDWTDKSTGTGSATYDSTDKNVDLAGGSSGIGWIEQQVDDCKAVLTTIRIDVGGGDIDYVIGTTTGASDVDSGTISSGLGQQITFTPAAGTIYVGFQNSNNDTRTIDNVVLTITAWSGLSHLEAESVKVRGDGFILDDATVTSGAITTSEGVTSIEAGINFAAEVETLPLITNLGNQVSFGDYVSLISTTLKLYNSRNVVVEVGDNTYKPPFPLFGANVLDESAALFTGWKEVFLSGIDRDVQMKVTQEEPLEFNLLAITAKLGV